MDSKIMYRSPAVAGKFYPSDPEKLRRQIAELMDRVPKVQIKGRVKGIITPHAGYLYSGFTAAHAFAALCGEKFETVVVVSPSHFEFFHGVSVYSGEAYATPLGMVEINKTLRDRIVREADFIFASEVGHGAEHALEVQLPFLQEILPPFSLLPLVIGEQSREFCFKLGEVLGKLLNNENALLVATTDLSHYYEAGIANKLDAVMLNDVADYDYEKLMSDLEAQRTEACGGGPTVAVMSAMKHLGVKNIEVLHHSNSGDVTGDYSSVVGYLSAVAYA